MTIPSASAAATLTVRNVAELKAARAANVATLVSATTAKFDRAAQLPITSAYTPRAVVFVELPSDCFSAATSVNAIRKVLAEQGYSPVVGDDFVAEPFSLAPGARTSLPVMFFFDWSKPGAKVEVQDKTYGCDRTE